MSVVNWRSFIQNAVTALRIVKRVSNKFSNCWQFTIAHREDDLSLWRTDSRVYLPACLTFNSWRLQNSMPSMTRITKLIFFIHFVVFPRCLLQNMPNSWKPLSLERVFSVTVRKQMCLARCLEKFRFRWYRQRKLLLLPRLCLNSHQVPAKVGRLPMEIKTHSQADQNQGS